MREKSTFPTKFFAIKHRITLSSTAGNAKNFPVLSATPTMPHHIPSQEQKLNLFLSPITLQDPIKCWPQVYTEPSSTARVTQSSLAPHGLLLWVTCNGPFTSLKSGGKEHREYFLFAVKRGASVSCQFIRDKGNKQIDPI